MSIQHRLTLMSRIGDHYDTEYQISLAKIELVWIILKNGTAIFKIQLPNHLWRRARAE